MQTNYSFDAPKGLPGLKYDLSTDICVSKTVEEADGIIKNGMAVVIGTAVGEQIKKPATKNDVFEGVVVRGGYQAENDKNGNALIPNGARVSVMTSGKIWALVDPTKGEDDEDTVTPKYGDAAYVVATGDNAGCFTTVADNNIAVDGIFLTEKENDIAVVYIR